MLDHDIYCFSSFTRIPGRSIFAVFGNVNQKLIGTRQVVNFKRKCPSDLQPLFQEKLGILFSNWLIQRDKVAICFIYPYHPYHSWYGFEIFIYIICNRTMLFLHIFSFCGFVFFLRSVFDETAMPLFAWFMVGFKIFVQIISDRIFKYLVLLVTTELWDHYPYFWSRNLCFLTMLFILR